MSDPLSRRGMRYPQGANATTRSPRAAIYARVSTADGRQTTRNQIAPLEKFCRARGWRIVERLIDHESGAKKAAGRSGLEALMSGAAARRFDIVCVFALDRLSREGVGETFGYLRRLKDAGVDFVSITEEHFRTTGPAGELLIAIAAWIAEQERRRHIERVQAGIERARKEGKRIGRPRSEAGKTGAELFQMREGESIAALAKLAGMSKATVFRRLQEFNQQQRTQHERSGIDRAQKTPERTRVTKRNRPVECKVSRGNPRPVLARKARRSRR